MNWNLLFYVENTKYTLKIIINTILYHQKFDCKSNYNSEYLIQVFKKLQQKEYYSGVHRMFFYFFLPVTSQLRMVELSNKRNYNQIFCIIINMLMSCLILWEREREKESYQ